MDERDSLPVEQFRVEEPKTNPDIVLPASEDHYEIGIWVKENIFMIVNDEFNRVTYLTRIRRNGRLMYDAVEYLKVIVEDEYQSDERRKAAALFFMEKELIK